MIAVSRLMLCLVSLQLWICLVLFRNQCIEGTYLLLTDISAEVKAQPLVTPCGGRVQLKALHSANNN